MNIFKRYSITKLFQYFLFYMFTKIVLKEAKFIRFPIDIRGKKYIKIGKGFTTGKNCRIEAYPIDNNKTLYICNNVQINDNVHITAVSKVVIGNNVLIASRVYISDSNHGNYNGDSTHSNPNIIPKDRELMSKAVFIRDNVWIGEGVAILSGVTIGKGSIIGANSVVTRNIPKYCIAVGSPAKVIKTYNFKTSRWEKVIID